MAIYCDVSRDWASVESRQRDTERKMKIQGEGPPLWSLSPIILCDKRPLMGATARQKPIHTPLKRTNSCRQVKASSCLKKKRPLLRSLLEHLSLFIMPSWYLEPGDVLLWRGHFTAPLILHSWWILPPDSYKAKPPWDGPVTGWRCRKAVGIYKCCRCSEIWEPYFNTREETHTQYIQACRHVPTNTGIRLQDSGACLCVCALWRACMGGFLCTFDTSLTGS